jgi:hypothetical protein
MRAAPFGYICFAVKTAAANLLQGLDNISGYQRHAKELLPPAGQRQHHGIS